MPIIQDSLVELIKQCLSNKREAIKEFYKIHYSFCLSVCMRYAVSKEDAKEMMNDGYLKVFQYLKSYDTNRPLKPWLRRIMVNSALDHMKKNSYGWEFVEVQENQAWENGEQPIDKLGYEEILGMVKMLPLGYRMVFNLHAIEGYTHEEIGQMLGIHEGTSKSNYAKARKKLQDYLANYLQIEK